MSLTTKFRWKRVKQVKWQRMKTEQTSLGALASSFQGTIDKKGHVRHMAKELIDFMLGFWNPELCAGSQGQVRMYVSVMT